MLNSYENKSVAFRDTGSVVKVDAAGFVVVEISGVLHLVAAKVVGSQVLKAGDYVEVEKLGHGVKWLRRIDQRPERPRSGASYCTITRIDPNGPAFGTDEQTGCRVVFSRHLFGDGLHTLRPGSVVAYETESTFGGQRTAALILSVNE